MWVYLIKIFLHQLFNKKLTILTSFYVLILQFSIQKLQGDPLIGQHKLLNKKCSIWHDYLNKRAKFLRTLAIWAWQALKVWKKAWKRPKELATRGFEPAILWLVDWRLSPLIYLSFSSGMIIYRGYNKICSLISEYYIQWICSVCYLRLKNHCKSKSSTV